MAELSACEEMIPRILHFVWVSDGDPVPPHYAELFNQAVSFHPDWGVRVWGYDNVCELGLTREDLCCPTRCGDCNIVRLYALNVMGGVYLDYDVRVLKPLDDLLNCEAFAARQADKWFGSAVLGSVPHSRYISWQVANYKRWVNYGAEWSPYLATQAPRDGLTEYPMEYFYPWSYDAEPEGRVPHDSSYTEHLWAFNWGTKQ